MDPDVETQWLDELFRSNGYDHRKTDFKQVKELELFSSSIPVIPSMNTITNLTVLRIVGCTISKIENLNCLSELNELWICEGKLTKLEGLNNNFKLQKMYMYDNNIEKIENISHLHLLTTLWLNKNKIQVVENLQELKKLKEVNLSDNQIQKIASCIQSNNLLEDFNLSGNLISSLEDITNLSRLPHLTSLGLKDPMSSANPVAFLCNYSTYVLYHMPTLTRLDSCDVSQKNIKEKASRTVSKKKVYYKMKIKALERSCTAAKSLFKEELVNLQEGPISRLQKLLNCKKEIEREITKIESGDNQENGTEESCTENVEHSQVREAIAVKLLLDKKLEAIEERIKYWEYKCDRLHLGFKEVCMQADKWKDKFVSYLQVEFASGGNILFEEGSVADVWYNSCQDLIQSRFASYEYKDLKVTGVKVHNITRIQNRLTKMKFDQKVDSITTTDNVTSICKNPQDRCLMDYLFFKFDSKIPPNKSELMNIFENGFNFQKSGAVQLTNSIYISDKHRIKSNVSKKKDFVSFGKCAFRFGLLLVCKVYLGKSCAFNREKKFNQSSYPNHHSAFLSKRHLVSSCPSKVKKGNYASSDMCDCTARRCTWFLFEPELIQPEYIIDFEYQTILTPPMVTIFSNVMMALAEDSLYQKVNQVYVKQEADKDARDEEILNMPPNISSRPRLTFLSEELLLQQSGKASLNKIVELNLHDSGLSKVKILATLSCLKKLILSFNELTSVNDLGGMSALEYLDVSVNLISGLDGFKQSPNLTYLDVSWNQLYYTREEIGHMRKHLPAIKVLHTSHNPWMKEDNLRLRCIGRLHSLYKMNDSEVTAEETNTALRLASTSRIAYITVLANSRTDKKPVQCLSLLKTTDALMTFSTKKPVKLRVDDKLWIGKVTCLHLDGQHLSKISNLEKLENLKWASFNNNDITKVEGFEACKNLVELSLSGNCITKIEGINHLSHLEHLDISNNCLLALNGIHFDKLTKLKHIAFDNNVILSLGGLQKSSSLVEIYAGNNKIQQMREIFHLKNISTLIILDMLDNPLVEESNHYRLFVIYHLQNLKALDGVPVDHTEGGVAKDTFGGKLSTDFIAEKLGHSNFLELCELDLPNCNLRTVVLGCNDSFNNLRSLNLEQNNLTHFGGIINLVHLQVLCLNHNHIETIVAKKPGRSSPLHVSKQCDVVEFPPVLERLEVLHLGYNSIINLAALQLARLPNLKALFLQGNEIIKLDGLDGLHELCELVLDKNKIKCFTEKTFESQWKLTELHIEENRLKELSYIESLVNLQRLYIGLNRIQDVAELDKLESLTKLFELSVIGNPVTKRLLHRPMLVFRLRQLLSIDGIIITNDERSKAELYFIEQQGGFQALHAMANSFDPSFPGLISTSKTKVSNLSSISNKVYWSPVAPVLNTQQMKHQAGRGRRRAKKKELATSPSNPLLFANMAARKGYDSRK